MSSIAANGVDIVNHSTEYYQNNILYDLYHDQPNRSKIPCRYLGLYKDKKVGHIGEVQAICLVRVNSNYEVEILENFALGWNNNELIPIKEEWKKRISELVKSTDYYDLKNEVIRFSIVEKFLPTNYKKISDGGIQGHRYFDLGKSEADKYDTIPDIFLSDDISLEKITKALDGKEWK